MSELLSQYVKENPSIEEYEEPSQEDFEDQEWILLPQVGLEDIHTAINTQVALESLADHIDLVKDAASLRQQAWVFGTLTNVTGLDIGQRTVSLEDYTSFPHQRTALALAVRDHAALLDQGINATLEDYTDTFGDTLMGLIKKASSVAEETKKITPTTNNVAPEQVPIKNKKLWKMLHVDGKQITLTRAADDERRNLQGLIATAKSAVKALSSGGDGVLLKDTKTYQLMFNTAVSFQDGKVKFTSNDVAKMQGERTVGRVVAGALVGSLFTPVGTVIGGVLAPKKSLEKITSSDISAGLGFINGITGLSSLLPSLGQVAEECHQAVQKAEDKNAVRKKAAPIMELLQLITKHITELNYGVRVLAKDLKKK